MSREFPYLDEDTYFQFPSIANVSPEGIVGAGGNLSPGMLLSAYRQGIFPWYSDDEPVLWWSPDPRFVLFPRELHVSKSMRRIMHGDEFSVTFDTAFGDVIAGCRKAPRPGQNGTWITDEVVEGYTKLHGLGYAHSVEVWSESELAGGLYGVSLGSIFFGESMFSRQPNSSKYALVSLTEMLVANGCKLIDCQVFTPYLSRFGARDMARREFLELLEEYLRDKTMRGSWKELAPSRC